MFQKQFTIDGDQWQFVKDRRAQDDINYSATVRMALDLLMAAWDDPKQRAVLLEQMEEA